MAPIDQLLEDLQRVSIKIARFEKMVSELRREQLHIKSQIRSMAGGSSSSPTPPPTASDAISQIIDVIRSSPDPVSISALAQQMQITRAAANLRLSRAVQAGLLKRAGKGSYVLATRAPAQARSETEEVPDDDIPF